MSLQRFLICIVFFAIVGLQPHSAYADVTQRYSAPGICGVASDVSSTGQFKIVDRFCDYVVTNKSDVFRLWGIVPDPQALKELIEGQRIVCTKFGSSKNRSSPRIGIVICSVDSLSGARGILTGNLTVNEYLLLQGQATEICGETTGGLRTCADEK